MRIVTVTGNHPRHAYLVGKVASTGLLAGTIVERRETFVPQPPDGLSARLAALFTLHFDRRAEAEETVVRWNSMLDGCRWHPCPGGRPGRR